MGSVSLPHLRADLLRTVGELYAAHCITASGGNVSARIPTRDWFLITPSRVFKGDLRARHLVRLDLDGRTVGRAAFPPSSEWRMHCAIYRARADVGAIVHAHAPQATVLGLSGLPFRPISAEAVLVGELPRVPFIPPGTAELANAVVEALGNRQAALLLHHGLVVVAGSLRQAANLVEIIERTAGMILGCAAVGREAPALPTDALAALRAPPSTAD